MAVNNSQVDELLGEYGSNIRESFINSFGADRKYFVDGERVEPRDLAKYGEPDEVIYNGISQKELDKAGKAVELLYISFREPPINEDVVIDQVVSAVDKNSGLEVYVPWNTGQKQESSEMNQMLTNLDIFGDMFRDETEIPLEFQIYSLEEYSELNNNEYDLMNDLLESNISRRANTSFTPWQEFTDSVLKGNWRQLKQEAGKEVESWPEQKKDDIRETGQNIEGDSLKYNILRLAESIGMNGNIRVSPGQNQDPERPSDDPRYIVPRLDQQFGGEGVIYLNSFYGPWKSDFEEINLINFVRGD